MKRFLQWLLITYLSLSLIELNPNPTNWTVKGIHSEGIVIAILFLLWLYVFINPNPNKTE